MSDGAGRPVSFLDEFTDMFRRANASSEDIFGEDTLYGMYGVAAKLNEKSEGKRKSFCVQLFWKIRRLTATF